MQSVGVVAKISGKVFVKRNGKLILLKQGDEIFLGDEIITQSSNDTIVINFDHAAPITLLEPQTIIITKELSNAKFDTQGNEAQVEEDKRAKIVENEDSNSKNSDENAQNSSHHSHGSSHGSDTASINGSNFDTQGHISNVVWFDGGTLELPAIISSEPAMPVSSISGAAPVVAEQKESAPAILAPSIALLKDLDGDGYINIAEAGGDPNHTSMAVAFNNDFKPGDKVTLEVVNNGVKTTLSYKVDPAGTSVINENNPSEILPITPNATNPDQKEFIIPSVAITPNAPFNVSSSITLANGASSAPTKTAASVDTVTPALSFTKVVLGKDLNGDGVIDASENGFNPASSTPSDDAKIVLSPNMKIGDKIKLTTTDPDGTLHEKTLIKTSSGTLVDKDSGESYALTSESGGNVGFNVASAVKISSSTPTNVNIQMISKSGNPGATDTITIANNNDPIAVFTLDENKDGIINAAELAKSGGTASLIDIYVPNNAAVGDKIRIKVDDPASTPTSVTKTYTIAPDGLTATLDGGSETISIQNGKITVADPTSSTDPSRKKLSTTIIDGTTGTPKASSVSEISSDTVAPVRSPHVQFAKDSDKDGVLTSKESGFSPDGAKTSIKMKIPNDARDGDKFEIDIAGSDGKTDKITIKISQNASGAYSATRDDGVAISVNNGTIETTTKLYGVTTNFTTTFTDKAGNKADPVTDEITVDNSIKVQFARDNDGDGLIDSITTPSGSPSTQSDLDIYVPSNAKPGSNVSVTISTPTIPAITTTVKYTISDDGLTALPSDGSAPLPIVDGKFSIPNVPISVDHSTPVRATITTPNEVTTTDGVRGRLFDFGILEYIDDVKLATQIDGGAVNIAKYLRVEDYEKVIQKNNFDDETKTIKEYNISLTNDEQPNIVFGVDRDPGTKLRLALEDDHGNAKILPSGQTYIDLVVGADKRVNMDFETLGIKLDERYSNIRATVLKSDGTKDDDLMVHIDLDATPDAIGTPTATSHVTSVDISGSVGTDASGNNTLNKNTINKVDLYDLLNSVHKSSALDDTHSYSENFALPANSTGANFMIKNADTAGNVSVSTVTFIGNSGLDADMWFYNYVDPSWTARVGGDSGVYTQRGGKSIYKDYIKIYSPSASTTYDVVQFASGTRYKTLRDQGNMHAEDLARVGRHGDSFLYDASNQYAPKKFGTNENISFANGILKGKPGNYTLGESNPVGSDLVMKMDGWIYVNAPGKYSIRAADLHNYAELTINGNTLKFGSATTFIQPSTEVSYGKNGQWYSTDYTFNKAGFYKFDLEYMDGTGEMNLSLYIMPKASAPNGPYPLDALVGSEHSGTRLFSNNYVEALIQNDFIKKIGNTNSYEINTSKYSEANFGDPIYLKQEGDVKGGNLDDAFVYSKGRAIDGKGGVDTLIVVDDVDFSNLDNVKKINNFEKVQLGSADQAVSIKFSPNGIFDIIDSRNTRDASNSPASESVNTVLKVIGDSKDLVQLTHDFVKATKADITTLNNKHSVVGDTYNKVDVTSDGDAVNQVYKATFDRYETINGRLIKSTHTVFVEIQDSVQVDLL
ncbi:hypothetical protein G6W43_02940 [Campylobacter concisus]|uniref:hypothetical protein n=1 Tax=Campylobacter concisus TaxID=199 RepID=UPI001883A1E6|nr:hypothetical protein [Campylobacter concisus]MBE9856209.1 hypothetical protein [Campylobacter concisus]